MMTTTKLKIEKKKPIVYPFYCKDRSGEYHKFTADNYWWRVHLFTKGAREYSVLTHKSTKEMIETFINHCSYRKITEKQWRNQTLKVLHLSVEAAGGIQ